MADGLHLSGWCSPTDQYHKGCTSKTCECPNHKKKIRKVRPKKKEIADERTKD